MRLGAAPRWAFWRSSPTLEERWAPRHNAFGVLRLAMAYCILLAHCWPLGYGRGNGGDGIFAHQTDLGNLGIDGLMVISGFLVTDSGLRYATREYLWRRFLRIFPGLWVGLLVVAFVIAPYVAWHERGNLDGFWTHSNGPFSYVVTNMFASMEQFSISGLFSSNVYTASDGGPFQGSLWTLRYEFVCYALIAVLIALAVLRRSPKVMLTLAALAYLLILRDVVTADSITIRPPSNGAIGPFPLIGAFAYTWVLYFGFLFLLGGVLRLYASRVPMSGPLATAAAGIALITAREGLWLALGLMAFAYLVLYAAVTLPGAFTRINRKYDYSFGIMLYSFPIQQVLTMWGWTRWGLPAYIVLATLFTIPFAVFSWHLIEAPALRLKNRRRTARLPALVPRT